MLRMMTKLMRHDDLEFFSGTILQQRVRHYDPSRISPSHNCRICLSRLLTKEPLVDSADWNIRLACKTGNTSLQLLVLNRPEFEKQWQQQNGSQIYEDDCQTGKGQRAIKPPFVRMGA